MEFRSLRESEMDQWLDHCVYVFNNGEYSEGYRQYFKNHYVNDPWRNLDSILVAVDQGKIVSTVRVFHRKIYLNGQVVPMGGIGEVSTKVEYRGKGLSTKLFSLAEQRMQEVGTKVSILGAALEKIGFYNKLGYEQLLRCFNVSTVMGDNELKYKIRPVNFYIDIPKLGMIYKMYSGKLNGVVVRDEDEYYVKWVKTEAKNLYVVEDENNTITAYIDFEKQDKAIKVREYGQLSGDESLFAPVVTKIVSMLGQDECEVIYSTAIKSAFKIEKNFVEDNEMIRLISPLEIGDRKIITTKELVKIICNISEKDKSGAFIFWDIDGF